MKAINVLSLFGGGETGYYALTQAGIKINKYFSSEIDPHCIAVSTCLYPSITHIGDIKYVRYANGSLLFSPRYSQCFAFEKANIDLIIGGSPCTSVSMAGKMEGLDGVSGLVSEYVRILNEVRAYNPKVKFVLENVKMKNTFLKQFNELLGCEPILIPASLVSAQYRRRYYWTNIEGVTMPEDSGIVLSDILEKSDTIPSSLWMPKDLLDKMFQVKDGKQLNIKEPCCLAIVPESPKPKGNYFPRERVFSVYGKARTVTTNLSQEAWYMTLDGYRRLTIVERERLQSLPDNYTKYGEYSGQVRLVPMGQRDKIVGNGWNASVVTHILSFMHKKDSTFVSKVKSFLKWR